MHDITITDDCNYIAAFLTMACPYRCPWCINEFSSPRGHEKIMSGRQWIAGLSRLANLEHLDGLVPVTLQGGEPSVHPDFYQIINGLPDRIRIDVLTNLWFDVEEMIRRVDPARLRRPAPYASIRVSYHPGQVDPEELFAKIHRMIEAGFSIGIWAVLHPDNHDHILEMQRRALSEGIDFRTKEFLGFADGKLYGRYKYPQACEMQRREKVMCRTTELLIGPSGAIYRCHHDLYAQAEPVGRLLDPAFHMTGKLRTCDNFGWCNPCDIKVKTNRLQQFGHTSVEIQFLSHELDESRRQTVCTSAE
jgi:pyruvate-formate lyase-activating enzyme